MSDESTSEDSSSKSGGNDSGDSIGGDSSTGETIPSPRPSIGPVSSSTDNDKDGDGDGDSDTSRSLTFTGGPMTGGPVAGATISLRRSTASGAPTRRPARNPTNRPLGNRKAAGGAFSAEEMARSSSSSAGESRELVARRDRGYNRHAGGGGGGGGDRVLTTGRSAAARSIRASISGKPRAATGIGGDRRKDAPAAARPAAGTMKVSFARDASLPLSRSSGSDSTGGTSGTSGGGGRGSGSSGGSRAARQSAASRARMTRFLPSKKNVGTLSSVSSLHSDSSVSNHGRSEGVGGGGAGGGGVLTLDGATSSRAYRRPMGESPGVTPRSAARLSSSLSGGALPRTVARKAIRPPQASSSTIGDSDRSNSGGSSASGSNSKAPQPDVSRSAYHSEGKTRGGSTGDGIISLKLQNAPATLEAGSVNETNGVALNGKYGSNGGITGLTPSLPPTVGAEGSGDVCEELTLAEYKLIFGSSSSEVSRNTRVLCSIYTCFSQKCACACLVTP